MRLLVENKSAGYHTQGHNAWKDRHPLCSPLNLVPLPVTRSPFISPSDDFPSTRGARSTCQPCREQHFGTQALLGPEVRSAQPHGERALRVGVVVVQEWDVRPCLLSLALTQAVCEFR